jgi:predicted transcriptional regulator
MNSKKINKILSIEATLKIISLFHNNPSYIDTPRGIAAWTNLDVSKVKQILKDLTKLGVITAHQTRSTTAYAYTQDAKIVALINKALKTSEKVRKEVK